MILQRNGLRASGCVAVLAAAVFLGGFASGVRAQTGAAADRAVLEALYDATDGPNWTNSANWKTAAPLDTWHGVWTDAAGRVTGLDLRINALSGPIPAALGSLANLRRLNLVGNDLSGPIPAALGGLTNLESLELTHNALSGPIPAALGSLTDLERLHLFTNNLSGPIPSALGSLTNLEVLYLFENNLSGPVPARLGDLAQLQELNLHGTRLTGALPPELTRLAALTHLDIGGTGLCAPADADFQAWLATLDYFRGDTCLPQTTGSVDGDRAALEAFYDATDGPNWTNSANWKTDAPLDTWHGVTTHASFGRVTGLALERGNGLSGPIPDALGSLTNLQTLEIWGNDLSGPIPDALGSLTNLQTLNLWGNDLSGPIPAWLGSLANLEHLDLALNDLSGPIPDELGSLTNLRVLWLNRNDLSGPIPDALGSLTNLERLILDGNDLSGPIPAALGSLRNLSWLSLQETDLTGRIPAALGSLRNLGWLSLSNSWGLSGPLPFGLRYSLATLEIMVTQACAPAAWSDWLKAIDFTGRLCGDEAAATVDVAVVHTPAAREAAGGAAEIDAIIDLMVAETNQAYEASGVRHRVALAGRAEVQLVETGESYNDLGRLTNMDEAHALRDRVGADLVHLIVDAERADVAGIAFTRGSHGLPNGAFALTAHNAGGATFAHELGHNMGLAHDRYTELGTGYYHWSSSYPAHGYVNQLGLVPGAGRSRRWITIMAYGTQCSDADIGCSQLHRFSNSRQRHGGDPLGVPYGADGSGATGPADAAAVLNATMPAVARWRDRPVRGNRPPTVADTLPDLRLPLHSTLVVDVSRAFADPDGDPLTYVASSAGSGRVTVLAAGARLTLTAVNTGSLPVRVKAFDPGGQSAEQSFTVTVSPRDRPAGSFTDNPILPGVTPVRAVHFTELRTRIDGLRQAAGLTPFGWSDPVLRAGATPVRLVHLLELRRALVAAYTASGRTPPRWTDAAPAAGTTLVQAVHLNELRAAVVALE